MKRKSKFLVFILSPVPGLSHLYLGWTQRALVFFTVFLGICMAGASLASMNFYTRSDFAALMAFFAYALLWFYALAEAMGLANQTPPGERNETMEEDSPSPAWQNQHFVISSRKMIAVAFSAIPGAGHMYLGLLKQGAQLMAAFFLVLVVTGWLQLGLLVFLPPLCGFNSLFDVYHLLEEEDELKAEASLFLTGFSTHPAWVGWGLVILGLLVVLQRIVTRFWSQS
jgi:hypothetical protein